MNAAKTCKTGYVRSVLLLLSFATCGNALLFPKPSLLPPTPTKALLKVAVAPTTLRKRRLVWRKRRLVRNRALLTGALLAGPPLAVGGVVAAAALSAVAPLEIYAPPAGALDGQSILVTGGTTGLGLETAKRLAVGRPANIVITARSDVKGRTAVEEILRYLNDKSDDEDPKESGGVNVSYRVLDLDDARGIENAVAEWLRDGAFPSRLDCLINNAGVMNLPKLELTADGVERQMSSNHLGHFVLTKLLAPRLTKRARIINVSSSAHQIAREGIDFDYCWEGGPKYDGWRSYGQSKLANILFSQELQRRAIAAGLEWDVACLHPGVVATDLWRQVVNEDNYRRARGAAATLEDSLPDGVKRGLDGLARKSGDLGIFKTVEQGATTSVWLAAEAYKYSNDRARTDARYYENCKPQTLRAVAEDADAAARLWKESEERAAIRFDFAEVTGMSTEDVRVEEKEDAEEEKVGVSEEKKTAIEEETEDMDSNDKLSPDNKMNMD